VVSFPVVIVIALIAFVLGMLTARRRQETKVIWETMPAPSAAHEAAIADPELQSLLAQKQTIGAIKRYRELTGTGLKESKDAIDALQRSGSGA
jgi:ribosomal protein L7/L12